jgi:hypothetical protein
MEEKKSSDIGEQIIAKIIELNEMIRKMKGRLKNAKECPLASSCRNRIS